MSATEFTVTAGKPYIDKDPNAELDYNVRFTAWLDAVTDTIASHTVTVVGVTLLSSTVVGGKVVVLWISGGTIGSPASATVRITTVAGRKEDQTVNFRIKEH